MIQSGTTLQSPVKPVQRGRLGQLIARQQELRDELIMDPLLDLGTVQQVLGISYRTLNRMLNTGELRKFQVRRHASRKVRQSVLREYLRRGDLGASNGQ